MTQFCDFSTLKLGWRPNQFLMLPAGFTAEADAHQTSPVLAASPTMACEKLVAIIEQEPRIEWREKDLDGQRLELIQRSKTFGFPDRISIAVFAGGTPETAALAVYSRAKVGIRDFGVNKARITRWVSALQKAMS